MNKISGAVFFKWFCGYRLIAVTGFTFIVFLVFMFSKAIVNIVIVWNEVLFWKKPLLFSLSIYKILCKELFLLLLKWIRSKNDDMKGITILWSIKNYSTRWRTCIKYATKNAGTNWNPSGAGKIKLLITEYFMYPTSCLSFLVKSTSKFVL